MLPETVKIFDIIYTIEYVDNPWALNDKEQLEGQADLTHHVIKIYYKNQDDRYVWNRLFHEIMHCIIDGFEFNNDNFKNDEHFIQLMATAINTILWDNEWLKEGLNED